MATWHITADSDITASKYTGALHSLILKHVAAQFERLGFSVQPMPEVGCAALSVSHSSQSAITLYLLQYGSENIHIRRVV
jgi:hypothetical protein